jgi:N-acylneuraminate cytidylyltransferase/CMP-N,N'-diacetyllegionaminic acid synthase
MIDGKNVLAIIPARGGSKGLPRKNVRIVAGQPLVAWPIQAALGSGYVDRVICSTDDSDIAAAARAAGADVPFMRPAELAGDTASSMAVVIHVLGRLEAAGSAFDYVALLEPTSPLTESGDIDSALERLHATREQADSIVGISKVEAAHPEFDVRVDAQGLIAPYLAADFTSLKRRQEIEDLFFLDGSLYISDVGAFRNQGSFYHSRTLGYTMPRWKAFEIDEFVDLVCVEALLLRRNEFTDQNSCL